MRNIVYFYQSTRKSQNWYFDGDSIKSKKCMTFKFREELCIMRMKKNAKFEEELTCLPKLTPRFDQF